MCCTASDYSHPSTCRSRSTSNARSQRLTQRPNSHRATGHAAELDRMRRSHSACTREAPTGRAIELTGRVTPGVRFESNKHPGTTGCVRSNVTGHATASDQPLAFCCPSRRLTGRAGPLSDRTRQLETLAPRATQAAATDRTHLVKLRPRPITPVTSVRLRFYPR
jgi:hypothetical protein